MIDWCASHQLVLYLAKRIGRPPTIALTVAMEAAESWRKIVGPEHHSDLSDRAWIVVESHDEFNYQGFWNMFQLLYLLASTMVTSSLNGMDSFAWAALFAATKACSWKQQNGCFHRNVKNWLFSGQKTLATKYCRILNTWWIDLKFGHYTWNS